MGYIDKGNEFDFGRVSEAYGLYRDIYPPSMFQKLRLFGVGNKGQTVLDVGTGTGVIPRQMAGPDIKFCATDLSENQIQQAVDLSVGKDIVYKACPAENTGFEPASFDIVTACQCFQYFDLSRFIPELKRILKPAGGFCKIFMAWLPGEDPVAAATEKLVLAYNPHWTGGGYKTSRYTTPEWSKQDFVLETLHIYKENIPFTVDSWNGRILTCRGIGASLPEEEVKIFSEKHKEMLEKVSLDGTLEICHEITIELYRLKECSEK